MRRIPMLMAILLLVDCGGGGPAASSEIEGRWEGLLTVQSMELAIAVEFGGMTDSLTAVIDIPAQGAIGLALTNVAVLEDSVSFDLPSGLGLARFRGVMAADSISGEFTQGSATGGFVLRRPGESAADLPYTVEEVEFETNGWTARGTLTIPAGDGPFPGAVLLSGSGIQDRNENVSGFEVFGVLADSLSRNGVAVLRCDDRGYGATPGQMLDITDSLLASDAALMLRFLEAGPSLDTTRTGFIGHSEGSTVALIAASDPGSGADFVICLAGPSVTGYEILLSQVEDLARLEGEDEERIEELVGLQRSIMDAILRGEPGRQQLDGLIEQQLRDEVAGLSAEELEELGDVDLYVASVKLQTLSVLESRWFAEFLALDPSVSAAGCSCPVLAVYGSLDVQVDPDVNGPRMQAVLESDPSSSVVVLEGVNHLFQTAVTGGIEEYGILEEAFDPALLPLILEWLRTL